MDNKLILGLNTEINEIESKNNNLIDKISDVKQINEKKKQDFDSLSQTNIDLNNQLAELDNDIINIDYKINVIKTKIENYQQ